MPIKKNKYGQYFTKQVIADFMVSMITKPHTASVLEPSCGKGVFIKSLLGAGFEKISAFEIDKELEPPYPFVRFESFVSSDLDEKFDVIIGNPPYIRWKNLEDDLKSELDGSPLWQKYFNSLCDYLFIFILKSIEQLNEEGELIFICNEYWLNTTNSQSLRDYMCRMGYISDIYHFKEAPLFEKATTSLIIFRFVKSRQARPNINLYFYAGKGLPSKEELETKDCFRKVEIPHFRENSRWLLATDATQDRLKILENSCSYKENLFNTAVHRIGEYCDIGNGMVSGMDKAFKITMPEMLNLFELSCLIKVLKAKDLDAYKYVSSSAYFMIQEHLSEEEFDEKCPNIKGLFAQYVSALRKRYDYGKAIPYWEFVFPRNYALFSRPEDKIFVPCKERISNKSHFRFCLAPSGFFPLQDVTAIVRKPGCKESIYYLLGYLNTPEVFNWLCYNGIIKGAIVEFSEAPISSIPFRAINWRREDEVSIHDEISTEIQLYLKDGDKGHIFNTNRLFKTLIS